MAPITEESYYRAGFLEAVALSSPEAASLVSGDFDIVVAASSWDRRSVVLTSAAYSANFGFLLLFTARDTRGLRDEHDRLLKEHLATRCKRVIVIEGESGDIETIWGNIEKSLTLAAAEYARPLKLLLDLSACPRYYSLGILGWGIRRGRVSQISILYAEGHYSSGTGAREVAFTGGHWRTVSAPYFEGVCDPGKDRLFLVSVGFEGGKTLRAVSRADPDRVCILFPRPGVEARYEQLALDANRELCEHYLISTGETIEAHASNAVAAWAAIQKGNLEYPTRENVYYLCCGTKPHSIAFALQALSTESPAVLYNVPEEHVVHDTQPNGKFWLYRITDLSAG